MRLDRLSIPADWPVWVLAPHPDDFDVIAVTMLHFQMNGNPIHLSVVSSGASGVLDEERAAASLKEKALLREDEQRASCQFFGLPESRLRFLRLDEDALGDPVDSIPNQDRIREELQRIRPAIVCLPHGHDSNPGHRRTYAMFNRLREDWPHPLSTLLVRDPKTLGMRTDLYLPFSAAKASWKACLLRFHRSQDRRNQLTRGHGFDHRILAMNRESAVDLPDSPTYAEVFELGTGEDTCPTLIPPDS